MSYWIGIICLYYGGFLLVLNEPSVRLKRSLKPWWRNDEHPQDDRIMFDILRAITFVGAVIVIELGVFLTEINAVALTARIGVYAVFGLVTLLIRFWVCSNSKAE